MTDLNDPDGSQLEDEIDRLRPRTRIRNVFEAVGLIACWALIVLLDFHVVGVVGMFLMPSPYGGWSIPTIVSWFGCALVGAGVFVVAERAHRQVTLAGATLLLSVVLWYFSMGSRLSILLTGIPFFLQWWAAFRGWRDARPEPEWQRVARKRAAERGKA